MISIEPNLTHAGRLDCFDSFFLFPFSPLSQVRLNRVQQLLKYASDVADRNGNNGGVTRVPLRDPPTCVESKKEGTLE